MNIAIFIGLVIVLAAIGYALLPLFEAREGRRALTTDQPDLRLENLLFERESVLGAIRDLQFDHAMDKLSEEDFTELDSRYRARAIEIMRQLDSLGIASPEEEDSDSALDHWIERAVEDLREGRRHVTGGAIPRDVEQAQGTS